MVGERGLLSVKIFLSGFGNGWLKYWAIVQFWVGRGTFWGWFLKLGRNIFTKLCIFHCMYLFSDRSIVGGRAGAKRARDMDGTNATRGRDTVTLQAYFRGTLTCSIKTKARFLFCSVAMSCCIETSPTMEGYYNTRFWDSDIFLFWAAGRIWEKPVLETSIISLMEVLITFKPIKINKSCRFAQMYVAPSPMQKPACAHLGCSEAIILGQIRKLSEWVKAETDFRPKKGEGDEIMMMITERFQIH